MKTKTTLRTAADALTGAEVEMDSITRKHPLAMLSVAATLGFAFGFFGVLKVLQASMALGIHDRYLNNGVLNISRSKSQMQRPTAHA